jgi:hypothetical protein
LKGRRFVWWAAEAAWIALLPIIAVLGVGISLVNHYGAVDAPFYTGYGLSFERMWDAFGLTYYAARFPVIAVNEASQSLLPGFTGYVIVRAAVFATCAIPLYLLARQLYGPLVAMAAYAFLVLNPLLPRILLWDLTTFLSIPAGLAAVALWYLAPGPWNPLVLLSGFLVGVSINSHVFTGTAIGVFLAVEAAFALRRPGGMPWLAARLLMVLAGAVVCLALGVHYYRSHVDYVSPQELWTITFAAIRAGQQYATVHSVPFSAYYASSYEIYVPVFTTLLLGVLSWRAPAMTPIEARISWFAGAYLVAYMVAVFVLGMNIVQFFWYFGHLTIVVYLSIPVIIGRLAARAGSVAAPVVFLAGLGGVASLVALNFGTVQRWSTFASGNGVAVTVVCAAMLLCVGCIALQQRGAVVAVVAAVAVVLQMPFLSETHLSLYDQVRNRTERPLFDVTVQFHALMNRYQEPESHLMLWYPTGSLVLRSLASSHLLYSLQDPWNPAPFPTFGAAERKRLAPIRFLLLMGEDRSPLEAGTRALDAARVGYSILKEERWGYFPVVVYARLLRLDRQLAP